MSKRIALNSRGATKTDQDAEEVISYIPAGLRVPYRFECDLLLRAPLISAEDATGFAVGTEIEILQAEIGDTGDVRIGFMGGDDAGICMLHEIELIDKEHQGCQAR